MTPDIIIVSTNDWNGFWFQRQEFATRFAARGHRVFYINRIPQRVPKPGRLFRWILSKRQVKTIVNPVPPGVRVLSPFLLPSFRILRPLNRRLWRRLWEGLETSERPVRPLLITYQPTYNVQDLADLVDASRIVYINTHVYDADPFCPKDLLRSEAELVSRAQVLMADSAHNAGRLKKYAPAREVYRAQPGVSVERFAAAYRGDESRRGKTLMFFGDIGRHLDLSLYNRLAKDFEVIFLGIVDSSVAAGISEKITLRPPVSPADLPESLRQADVLTIFYKPSDYVSGIIPAKFYECLATGKPVFISGLPETRPFENAIYYITGGAQEAADLLGRLEKEETEERRAARRAAAEEADWENRFNEFSLRVLGS